MRKYDKIIAAFLLTYLVMALLLGFVCRGGNAKEDVSYKVEINQIMQGLEDAGAFSRPDLRDMQYVCAVSFLPAEVVYSQKTESQISAESMAKKESEPGSETELAQEQTKEQIRELHDFYRNHNGVNSTVYPLMIGDTLAGYVRFDYTSGVRENRILWLTEGVLLVSWLMIFGVLWYIRIRIIKPFHVISEMPYELAKGHLQVETEENRGRYFGKFVWGISMLRDTLDASKAKALKLEKEKKLLLLSVSHDIKIPLSAIRLYAKALREDVYQTADERMHAVSQIEGHAQEIEEFVKKIVNTASEDMIETEVVNSEFYLGDYMDQIRKSYEPKCRLAMTEFTISQYGNKMLKGDMDRAVEVMENLLENAMKYGDGKRIRIDFYEEDYCQVIEVFNTGVPVAQNQMPHLFDSFYRGSNAQDKKGNGLGLYIARQIMLKMEGDIFAKRLEEGMSFGLVFEI